MLPLVCNLPMICLLLSMTVGILTALVRNGRRAFFLTAALLVAVTAASAAVLVYTWNTGESFTYTLGLYPPPLWALNSGPGCWRGFWPPASQW